MVIIFIAKCIGLIFRNGVHRKIMRWGLKVYESGNKGVHRSENHVRKKFNALILDKNIR